MRAHCRKVYAVALALLHSVRTDWRIWFVLLLEGFQVIRYLSGILLFGLENRLNCTPFMLAFLFSDGTIANGLLKVQIYFGLVILLCNAPFRNEHVQYLIVRSGKRAWWHGVCGYIITMSFLYLSFLTIISTLAVLPIITLRPVWGSAVLEIIQRGGEAMFRYGRGTVFPADLINVIYPWAVQALTFLTAWLSFILIGFVICLVNEVTGRTMLGCGAAAFFILLDPVVRWLAYYRERYWWYYVSPVSWTSLEHWDILGLSYPLHGNTVILMSVILIILLAWTNGVIIRYREVSIQESM